MPIKSNWGSHPIVVLIGLIGSIVTILAFVTGRPNLGQFLPEISQHIDFSKLTSLFMEPRLIPAQQAIDGNERFIRLRCGAIQDKRTGLECFVGPDRNMTWYEAKSWIDNLFECDRRWRMPKVEELRTLFDPKKSAGQGYYKGGKNWPAHIDPIFNAIGDGSWVWAGDKPEGETARSFNFNQGGPTTYSALDIDYTTRALAVRNNFP